MHTHSSLSAICPSISIILNGAKHGGVMNLFYSVFILMSYYCIDDIDIFIDAAV